MLAVGVCEVPVDIGKGYTLLLLARLINCKDEVLAVSFGAFHNDSTVSVVVVVVVVDPTPPTCCQQSPAPEIMWQPAVSPPRWQGKAPLCRDSSRGPG